MKRDHVNMLKGLIVGLGLLGAIWFYRRKRALPVLAPTAIKWDSP